MSAEAATAYRVEQELLNDALSRGVTVSPQMREGFRQLAQEAGVAEQALASLKLSQDLVFERQQLGRSETEQRVYSELRAANIDISSATGQRLADEIRMVEHLKDQKAIVDEMSDVFSDMFTQPLRDGEKFIDRLISGFASIGRSFAQKGIEGLMKQWGISGPANFTAAQPLKASAALTGREIGQSIAPVIERNLSSTLTSFAAAIRKIESGSYDGNYGAIGPVTRSGDRAYGAYQVMGNNIASWTKEVVGQSLSVKEFLADRAVQDRVFFTKFGQSIEKFGSAADATSVWFSGRPLSRAGDASDGYNTVPQYLSKVQAAVDGFPSGLREGVASGVVDANRKLQGAGSVVASGGAGLGGMFGGNGQNLLQAGGALLGAFSNGAQSGSPIMGGLSGAMSGLGAAPALSALGLGSMATPVGLVVGAALGRLGSIQFKKGKIVR
jgi:post-segregation antitoxin (ccd killing protein)